MGKKMIILVIATSLAAVLALGIGGAAMASTSNANPTAAAEQYADPDNGFGIGLGGDAICTENVSALLGLTPDEIQALRKEGKSLLQIAEAQGVTQEQLVATIMETRQAWIEAGLANGTLTQERATLMEQNMEQNVIRMINHTLGKPDWAGQGNNGNGKGNAYGNGRGQANRNGGNGSFGKGNMGRGNGQLNRNFGDCPMFDNNDGDTTPTSTLTGTQL